jgi:hypothetical protein
MPSYIGSINTKLIKCTPAHMQVQKSQELWSMVEYYSRDCSCSGLSWLVRMDYLWRKKDRALLLLTTEMRLTKLSYSLKGNARETCQQARE